MSQTKIEKIKAFNASQQANADAANNQPIKGKLQPGDDPTLTTRQKVEAKANPPTLTKEEQEAEDKRIQEEEAKAQLDSLHQLEDATSTLIDRVNQPIGRAQQWLSSQPTPGGIAALLVFIVFLALAVIPVNSQGQTRLFLMWQTILGRTHLLSREKQQIGGQASGSFTVTPSGGGGPGATSQPTNGLAPIDITHLNILGF